MSAVMNVPDGWTVNIVENLAKIITGTKDTQDRLEDGKYPFYVRSNTVERINSYSFDGEAILTAGDGVGVGKVFHHVNEKFDFHQRVYCIFNFSTELNPKFFFEYFKENFIKRVNKYSAKGSVDSVRYDMISLMEIPIPPIQEQQRIAEILSTLDQTIEATQKLIAKEKNIKKGLMHDLLTNGIDSHGKIRTPLTHKYKESKFGLIPEEWEVKKVGRLVEDKVFDKVQDGNHGEIHPQSKDFVDTGIPFVMASDIQNGYIDLEKCKRISTKTYNSLRIGFSHYDDVLLSHKASIGFTAIVPKNLHIMLTPQVTYYRVLNKNSMLNTFLLYYFQSDSFQNILSNLSKQSTRDYIGISMQKELPIYYPIDIEEQKKIATILTTQDKKIETEENNFTKLKELKKGLMNDLLSGTVRVKT